MNQHYLANIIGQPLETTIALSKLILAGLFDRHPALKLIAAHGGVYLGAYAGRLDHGWRVRPEARTCLKLPSEYLRQIWFDTIVYDPQQIRALIDTVGVSQLLVGTDYPFDMGIEYTPLWTQSKSWMQMIGGQFWGDQPNNFCD